MTDILTPVGRLVQGSVHEIETVTDPVTKQVKLNKLGQPRSQCYFAVAVPKTANDWRSEPWGPTIHQVALGAFPNGQTNNPAFAWKIVDGDSTTPDKSNKRPCDKQGFPGNWVLRFSGGFLPQLVNRDGTEKLPAEQKIELGDYVQVFGSVVGNGSVQSPGIYLNHKAVAFVGYGERIVYERDYSQAGFGQAPVPAGVKSAPVGALSGAPQAIAPAAPAPAYVPPAAPAAPVAPAVQPNPAVLQAPPMAPPAPPAPAVRQMTAAATGTYEAYVAAGWSDAQLIQHGLMVG